MRDPRMRDASVILSGAKDLLAALAEAYLESRAHSARSRSSRHESRSFAPSSRALLEGRRFGPQDDI